MDDHVNSQTEMQVSDADDVWTQVALSLRSQLAESVWFSTFQEVVPATGSRGWTRSAASRPSPSTRKRVDREGLEGWPQLRIALPLQRSTLPEGPEGG